MALATYSDLKASLAAWLDGSDLSGRQSDLVALAESEINPRLADAINNGAVIRPMLFRSTISITTEYQTLTDSSFSMVSPISMEITGLDTPWQVTHVAPESIVGLKDGAATDTCPPRHYAIIGDEMRFFPAPAITYSAEFTRYVQLPALSDTNTANWLLTRHPNAYLYGALAQAELLGWNDEGVARFASLFETAMAGVIASYPERADFRPLTADYPLCVQYLPC